LLFLFAVSCCFSLFSAVFARRFSLLFWWCGYQKARVYAAESGRAAVFFRHFQRHQRAPSVSGPTFVALFLPVCRV
jgi:hypothetical protein